MTKLPRSAHLPHLSGSDKQLHLEFVNIRTTLPKPCLEIVTTLQLCSYLIPTFKR